MSRQRNQPGEVVAWLAAVQSQDYASAKWSIGLRLPGSTDALVEQAFAVKTTLRTWAMRGTLHFISAADMDWVIALVAPCIIAGDARRYKELELDEDMLFQSNSELESALQSGKQPSRTELLAVLEENGISTRGQRAAYMLQRASLDGQTYWLPHAMPSKNDSSPRICLLPGFDEYLLSYRDRSASIDRLHFKMLAAKNGMLSSTIVLDARVAGTWKRTFRKGAVVIASNPFTVLTESENHAFAAAARRYAEFLGMPVEFQ